MNGPVRQARSPIMRDAEEFSGQRSGLRRAAVPPAGIERRGLAGAGRIRYAYGGRDLSGEAWPAESPAGRRRTDLWVLVCGGIAAAAAFAAAFVAAGGVASHPAAPGAAVPAVVSQACPSPAAGPAP
jgi:hypothetical protein